MKNASIILNAVLLVAVGVLFYLHFSSKQKAQPAVVRSAVGSDSAVTDFRIAYFELDSINNSFAMMKDVKSILTREEDKITNEISRLQKLYNDKLTQYQNQGEMSAVQSDAATREMMNLQDRIRNQKQEMDQKYQDLWMRKMQEVKLRVEDFLKEYNKTKGYSYIFAYEPSFIYYRDTIYNITSDLVKGLNEEYKEKKK